MIEESQDLETHLNLITDFTRGLVRILLSTMSCGRWFFLCRRTTGGSLISDTFRHIDGMRSEKIMRHSFLYLVKGSVKEMELIMRQSFLVSNSLRA